MRDLRARRCCRRLGTRRRPEAGLQPCPGGARPHRRRRCGGIRGRHRDGRPAGRANVSGSPDDKQFLLEEMGCGAAFFDYDHDGWLDIFLVNGSSLDRAASTAADQLSLPQQS